MSDNKFSALVEYFQSIVLQHVDLQEFYRLELDEVLTNIRDLKTPCLVLEGYKFSYKDQRSDNPVKIRSGAFILLNLVNDPTDFEGIYNTWDQLEEIADEIIARIRSDKENRNTVIKGFDIESIDGQLLASDVTNYYGIRITFEIQTKFNQQVDQSKWTTS